MGPYCPFAWKGDFFEKVLHYCLPIVPHCATMSQKRLYSRQMMRYKVYKVLLFCAKLGTNHPLALTDFCFCFEKLTDVNFVYFMYPITILHCLKKSLKWVTEYIHNFWANLSGACLEGKLTITTFVNLLCSS